jgi:hypothetical protein
LEFDENVLNRLLEVNKNTCSNVHAHHPTISSTIYIYFFLMIKFGGRDGGKFTSNVENITTAFFTVLVSSSTKE